MKTSRRGFIAGMLAASAAAKVSWAAAGSPAFLAGAREPDGSYALHGFTEEGEMLFSVPLPARGHCGAGHPTRAEAVAFARRPGQYALVVDCINGTVKHELTPPEGVDFNGHGNFINGGALLLTAEQMADGSDGLIGIWDAENGYERIGSFASHGIGPHDVFEMPDGETLVVANGGIQTDHNTREKLNTDVMRPSLAYFDKQGTLLEQVFLDDDLHQNSIRHLAITQDGLVAFAMQWEGEEGYAPPLLGLHKRGEDLILAEAPLADELAMVGYAGSVAMALDESEFAISSPRGGRVHLFDRTGAFLGAVSRTDVCGLAPHPEGILASDGLGGLIVMQGDTARRLGHADVAWDNHIVALPRA